MKDYQHYIYLSELFGYPSGNLAEVTEQCLDFLGENYGDAAEKLCKFRNFLEASPLNTLEEIYTRTFHIQAICYLDLGYVMFGEDYKRGAFLVNMKKEQEKAGNDCGFELPDNLVNVLTLIPKLEDSEFRDELIARILIPAVVKMLAEFDSSRIEQKRDALRKKHKALIMDGEENVNIYQYAIESLLMVLKKDFSAVYGDENEAPSYMVNPFLNNCGSCSAFGMQTIKN